MISDAISLVRSREGQNQGNETPTALSDAEVRDSNAESKPDVTQGSAHRETNQLVDDMPVTSSLEANEPLSSYDFSSLFDISPGLLARAHVAAVERMYACSSDEDSNDGDTEEDKPDASDDDPAAGPTVQDKALAPIGKYPRLSRQPSLARTSSRSNSLSKSVPASRQHFVIDPSAVAIPTGHPDVVQTQPNSLSITSVGSANSDASAVRQNGSGDASRQSAAQTPQLSPKSLSLRQQLFPEFEQEASAEASMQAPPSPHNNTSTDGGSESDEASHAHAVRGVHERDENGAGRGRRAGRKLWEVVDSVRLLDGVL